jgi:hypothetical protein
MIPLQALLCPVAVIGISTIYSAWHRYRASLESRDQVLRERLTYMLWVTASRA